ncbi:RNA pyrophosphohydrolase [Rhodobacter capsulatus]|jgi:putative (di)nucleoside polyphosphate hydrolase|uniref:RNA pyrophosphohydrolase n=1 Tax=Rhodobacter capsulatus (strain ATCC BAA-309 / NBRC 16581 / SB1003) TaxID=272942 RepID=D5AKJ7_RHOCB|nr:RNA pyrophosphohydrolase [Rhodobacter capsulatus]ADE83839.1 (di)nucleoside polyphosphate hydrolase [Rhodobacter capsulatus SB 1003]ETD03553.1 RNA pyrophosphohydrolase [Rhodobacter capsulatus DE442]ETD80346.1 RNA pyrophosphohydrolase [Rhodobacter capsulatus R121]ETE55613.1 RNA pyrophosphohydrolase [Rhodobacter capsulatus Y262]MDS0925430.1 RNA pyrophosphohydrolase [Rhodobacter capsulatus]
MTPEELAALPYRKNVGLVLINAEGLIFAGQRIDNPGHAWQMPQGGIDAGERPKEAALRELQEETGVRPDLVEKLAKTEDWLVYDLPEELIGNIWGGKYRGQKQKWFLFRFLGQDSDVNIATEHPEFSVWRWMEPAELVEKIVPFKRAVYEQVFDSFAEHLKK